MKNPPNSLQQVIIIINQILSTLSLLIFILPATSQFLQLGANDYVYALLILTAWTIIFLFINIHIYTRITNYWQKHPSWKIIGLNPLFSIMLTTLLIAFLSYQLIQYFFEVSLL